MPSARRPARPNLNTVSISAYLQRLGIDEALPPTIESLRLLHRRHLERVPYENLGIMAGSTPSVDPADCLQRIGDFGRAGYCFHQNAALELVLRDLGFDVQRRHGHVWTDPADRDAPELNHLALVVSGLPTDDNPGGRWWPDVGLGEGFLDPLPLRVGEYDDGAMRFAITDVSKSGWSYRNDPRGSFAGLEVTNRPTDPVAVLNAHAQLSTAPEGVFTRLLIAQRRDDDGLNTVRGCVAVRIDAAGRHETDLTSYESWRGALESIGVSLDGLEDDALRALFERSLAAHARWVAARRP